MAIYHLHIQPIKRSEGRTATGAAAYRAGERIRDERSGQLHNFSKRKDVRHTEILLPSRFGTSAMEWARDRSSLWNHAEAAESRRNARVAREFQVMLPVELDHPQRLALARSFARELSDRYGVAIDLAIHDPNPARSGSNNFHAHLLATTREVTEAGLGAKAGLDMQALARTKLGLANHSEEYTAVRERWANLTNDALREANIDARVDHRSLAAQGIDRKPLVHVPLEFYHIEKRGVPKQVAESLRNDYRARVSAYLERTQGTTHEQAQGAKPEESRGAQPPPAIDPRNIEEVRRQAVQEWLRIRPKEAERSLEPERQQEPQSGREVDDF